MPKDLYLRLVAGPTVHVTDQWDGNAPTRYGTVDATGAPDDGEGIEAGDYYRDIHRASRSVRASAGSVTVGAPASPGGTPPVDTVVGEVVTVDAAILPSETLTVDTVTGTAAGSSHLNTFLTKGIVPASFSASVSDEKAHEKPRTWQKVCTWLKFVGADGTEYDWRASLVAGWSDQAPLD